MELQKSSIRLDYILPVGFVVCLFVVGFFNHSFYTMYSYAALMLKKLNFWEECRVLGFGFVVHEFFLNKI